MMVIRISRAIIHIDQNPHVFAGRLVLRTVERDIEDAYLGGASGQSCGTQT